MGQESWRGGAAVVVCLLPSHLERQLDGRKAVCTSIQHSVVHVLLECNEFEFPRVLCRKLRCGKGGWGGGPPCPVAPSHTSIPLPLTGLVGISKTLGVNFSPPKHSDTPRLQQTPFSPKRPRCLPTAAPEAYIPRPRTSSRRQVSVPTPHQRQASHALALPRPHHGPRRRAPLELEHSVGDPTPLLPLQPLRHDPVRPSLP